MNENSPQKPSDAPTVVDSTISLPQVPDHQLLRRIDEGSYGEVWLARTVLGDYRAVKIVYRRTFQNERPYEREFKGIQNFEPISRTHDSQVDILHVGRNDQAGYFYYVMELADDLHTGQQINPDIYFPRTLKSELARHGRLPFEQCVQIGLSLTTAVEHLHTNGLVHRDIKPANIVFIKGVPKLADIGLVADSGEAKSFVGTEGYLSPEGPGPPTADLYSLGKVLYEISLGRKGQVFPELPPDWDELADQEKLLELNEVILKACQSDLRLRYESAKQMHDELALLQTGKSVKRKHTVERRWTIAKRLTFGVVALVALAFIVQQVTTALSPSAFKANIFVLPFRNEGTNGIPDDLRGRITDAFIDALPLIDGVKTGPRKSGWVNRDEDELRHSLAKTNDVRHILTGRTATTNDTISLTLQLYKKRGDQPLWSETFSRKTNEVVALEQRAIQVISSKLGLKMTEEEQRQIRPLLTNNLEAIDWLRQAKLVFNTQINVFKNVIDLTQKARSLDTNYLEADFFTPTCYA